ncbi:gluconokinase [Micromonospora sp. WMMD712]|uniref:gluconokinase n=1 Tax=Micromonospora sp. WMMD712 TaxID=3016096 RepID=UPI00249CE8CC|nr:gluconokinase [Micromonospora sp. WMMD712]WFE60276.1 gluconokinase [Micromonospora sp. WMMD712]
MADPDQRPHVVIGVDIGTTSTKSVAYDTDGRQLASHSVGYPLDEPQPGFAEQDPSLILDAVVETIRTVVAGLPGPVAGLSFSTAMHSLIGLDPDGQPLTPSVTWADSRASRQAERLRAARSGLALHRRTGTPVHPMAPLPKLVWFAEQEPKLFGRVAHWVGIKDHVLLRLCGALVTDHSVASASGLMDIQTRAWDAEALRIAGISEEQLPQLVATTTVLPGLTAEYAAATGLPADTPVVVGAGDGPLANLGLGAVRPGVVACSIGTSGAMRVMVERPAVDPLGGVFCYALTEDRWVVGGAINNGGIVLQWAGDALAPELGEDSEEELLALAARAPVGSGGLVMLPYLLSERAPHWSALPRGAYVGLTHGHRREHLVRAALEGVCQQLALVLASVRSAGNEVREVRASGGFARSPLWRQMLADALGMPVRFPAGHEGSSFGAALLGMQALGLIASVDVAADLVRIDETVRPDPAAAATYAALLPVHAELYEALVPTFTSLRRLAPDLPPEPPPTAPPMCSPVPPSARTPSEGRDTRGHTPRRTGGTPHRRR